MSARGLRVTTEMFVNHGSCTLHNNTVQADYRIPLDKHVMIYDHFAAKPSVSPSFPDATLATVDRNA